MPLVNAKCTNCGANLEVDNTKDAAICPYCGSAYIVEKAINNYNITNNTTNSINAEVVNVYGGNSGDFVIRGGVLEKYTGAATDVVIPDNVTVIGKEAFAECAGITSIIIPDNVTIIGEKAFAECAGITSIIIPDSVTEIPHEAFYSCSHLSEVVLPSGLQKIGGGAFACSGVSYIEIPRTVKEMGVDVFGNCKNLQEVILPEGIEIIPFGFFDGSGITKVTIPKSVKIIEDYAFYNCHQLKEITVLGTPELKYDYDDSWSHAFRNCEQLSIVNAPEEWKVYNCRHIGCVEREVRKRENARVCVYCGGKFKGLINRVCTNCNRPKNY